MTEVRPYFIRERNSWKTTQHSHNLYYVKYAFGQLQYGHGLGAYLCACTRLE
jgi:hypothetical protein